MLLRSSLVHAESGRRVVRVSAHEGDRLLGSALGEASDAEQAEDRALARLKARLGPPAVAGGGDVPATATGAPPSSTPPSSTPPSSSAPPSSTPPPRPSPPTAPEEPAPDPEDWSAELAQLDLQLRRLEWGRDQEGIYLQRGFGHPSRSRLTSYADLTAYLGALKGLAPGCDPSTALVPLRRRDLLHQSDQLLRTLGWDAERGRRFLERHLGAASRQKLSDKELLQFNMLLEGELMESAAQE